MNIVACCYYEDPIYFSRRLSGLLDKFSIQHQGLLCSSLEIDDRGLDERWSSRLSDNISLDFSAYFEGAKYFDGTGSDLPILFVNDTLFSRHSPAIHIRGLLRLMPLIEEIRSPLISGKCDYYSSICLLNPWSTVDRYVSSYFFVVNKHSLPLLEEIQRECQADGLFDDVDPLSSDWAPRLNKCFREFLRANLFYSLSPLSWQRLKRGRIPNELLRAKARCIYFEHRLSGFARDHACILPINAGFRWSLTIGFLEFFARLKSYSLGLLSKS